MQDQAQPKNPKNDKIGTAARIWRAIDKVAIATPPRSPEREAEYRARQELRKVVDEAGET
ncbi:hypothetical protein [Massilia aerilata]|uniref:Uncharacterized protein n=1 Tax=Massilia aerilata TaxID=453817 RepID=A0ABW0S2Q1_9BURK